MRREPRSGQRGSAMIMAVFVLALLASVGAALLFITDNELKMSQADVASKQVFFLSEGGLEAGRHEIFLMNKNSANVRDLSEELQTVSSDGTIDFDPTSLAPTYDSSGQVTGFTGFNDDVPLKSMTALADGWYVTFMQNDPAEGVSTVVDDNDRVLLTAMAVRNDRRVEMTRALVERLDTFAIPPSTITILGPDAEFNGGSSSAKFYVGDDHGPHCPPGTSGNVPTVGVIGGGSLDTADDGMIKPDTYESGGVTGLPTMSDLTTDPDLPELWTNCELLVELAQIIHASADLIGDTNTPRDSLGVPGAEKVVYINGDYEINGNWDGGGLLLVTGDLEFSGQSGWQGPIFVIGTGDFLRSGAGNGEISGGVVVANVAGPDRTLFTADDCAGQDGVSGTSDDGVAGSRYVNDGGGTGITGYCSAYFTDWQSLRPFKLLSFLQE
ncbi:MAG TPA: hypothetical protein VD788_14780 [Candidatus Polarisedimenticolaceae bacterium]|nr:hypothetical protein [Candidatus Polarisedimenticolaceae bacterium]